MNQTINPELRQRLETERALGRERNHLYETFMKGFVEEKRQLLFERFCEASITDVDALKTIKTQLYAIDSMEQEFVRPIETGKLADKALREDEEIKQRQR